MGTLFVLYYHRILPFHGYDTDLSTFEWQLKYLTQRFEIVGLETVLSAIEGKHPRKNSVLLTFDDGYFDNYVYAYPILKKYKAKAVVFVSTSKIKHGAARKTLENYWDGHISFKDLKQPRAEETALADSLKGITEEFLTWEELKEMVDSGIFEVGSHGHTHTKIFVSDKIIGRNKIDVNPHWSFSYISEDKPGLPVYPMKSALWGRQYIPEKGSRGRFETQEEAMERIKKELEMSRNLIEKNLTTEAYSVCWPWGEYSGISIDAAKEVGFRLGFSTKQGRISQKSNRYALPRISASRNKNRFRKRAFIYSKPILADVYSIFKR